MSSANLPATVREVPVEAISGSKKLSSIESARGVAALLVVLAHATSIIAEPRFYGRVVFDGVLLAGGAGVDFFFVLSGFIIAWAHLRDIGHPQRIANYAFRRFARIYPPYWCVLLPLIVLYALHPGAGEPSQHHPVNAFFSITLLPYREPPVLGAAWTLVYEMAFYCTFGLFILIGRASVLVGALWAVAIVVAQFLELPPYPVSMPLNALNLEFLMGIAGAMFLRRRALPAPAVMATIGVVLFFVFFAIAPIVNSNAFLGRCVFGSSSLLIILGLAETERRGKLKVPKPLILLGASSYSLYLIHGPALSAAIQLTSRWLPQTLPLFVVLCVLTTFSIAGGVVFHLVIERPLTTRLRRMWEQMNRQ